MKLEVFIEITGKDKQGREEKPIIFKANSIVGTFVGFLAGHFSDANKTVVDITNANKNSRTSFALATGGGGTVTRGIICGTGTTAVALTNYKIETIIAHGTGSGQLSYGAMSFDAGLTDSGSTRYFQMYRQITNNSGANITVNELALYVSDGYYVTFNYMIDRTLQTFTINNGTSKTITYKFAITV